MSAAFGRKCIWRIFEHLHTVMIFLLSDALLFPQDCHECDLLSDPNKFYRSLKPTLLQQLPNVFPNCLLKSCVYNIWDFCGNTTATKRSLLITEIDRHVYANQLHTITTNRIFMK